jgi:hypothetical protein
MTQPLPTGGYKKLSERQVADFNIADVDLKGPKGYLLNVDVKVPKDPRLHEFLSDRPPFPEKIVIPDSCASEFQKMTQIDNPGLLSSFGSEQYLCRLLDKNNYSVFVPSLKQALDVGLEIEKKNGIWEFDQTPFMREWVLQNVSLRTQASCMSRKQFLKLILNAFYGRTAMNVSKFRDFVFASDHLRALHLI